MALKTPSSHVPRLVREIQEIYARTLDPADKPQGVGKDVTKRQGQAAGRKIRPEPEKNPKFWNCQMVRQECNKS
jgi:hypothetical protein